MITKLFRIISDNCETIPENYRTIAELSATTPESSAMILKSSAMILKGSAMIAELSAIVRRKKACCFLLIYFTIANVIFYPSLNSFENIFADHDPRRAARDRRCGSPDRNSRTSSRRQQPSRKLVADLPADR